MGAKLFHAFKLTIPEDAASGLPGGPVGPNEWNAGEQLYLDVNAQTGVTYPVVAADDGAMITFANSNPVAITLPQAQAGAPVQGNPLGFFRGWFAIFKNIGPGAATITPTISKIDGAAALSLSAGQSALLISDGTDYQTFPKPLNFAAI